MSFDEIESAWRSPRNQPAPAELMLQKERFLTELRRRHRGFTLFISSVFLTLSVITGRLIYHVVQTPAGTGGITFAGDWGTWILLALTWLAPILLIRQYRNHRRRTHTLQPTFLDSVRSLLSENHVSRVRLRTVAALHGSLLLLLPIIVWQLRSAGKAGDEIIIPAFVLWPLLSLTILGCMFWHDRRRLLPRKHELESLLKSYE